jgi:hypothetical protein
VNRGGIGFDVAVEVGFEVAVAFEVELPLWRCQFCDAENGSEMNVV